MRRPPILSEAGRDSRQNDKGSDYCNTSLVTADPAFFPEKTGSGVDPTCGFYLATDLSNSVVKPSFRAPGGAGSLVSFGGPIGILYIKGVSSRIEAVLTTGFLAPGGIGRIYDASGNRLTNLPLGNLLARP